MSKLSNTQQLDALYAMLYHVAHDLERSPDLTALQTRSAFAKQWSELPTGNYLLGDDWFRDNVTRIVCEQEILLKPDWFRGKRVLDAGCGNGRWAYALSKLGAEVTALDVNPIALDEARASLDRLGEKAEFVASPLEEAAETLGERKFDLVWSWGVVHHTQCFNRSLDQLTQLVAADGILYLYLYGRESMTFEQDLELFKQRVHYNALGSDAARQEYLLQAAGGDPSKVHNQHDLLAPLVNRRLEWDYVREFLLERGFPEVTRTIDHTELFVRAAKNPQALESFALPPKDPPFWFQHHALAESKQ